MSEKGRYARTCSDENSQKEYLFFFRESQEDDLSELVSFDGMVNEVFQPHVPIIGKETKKPGGSKCAFKKNFWHGKCIEGCGPSFLPPRLHLPDDIVNSHCSYFASPLPPLAIVT